MRELRFKEIKQFTHNHEWSQNSNVGPRLQSLGSLRPLNILCDLEKAIPMWAADRKITTWHFILL